MDRSGRTHESGSRTPRSAFQSGGRDPARSTDTWRRLRPCFPWPEDRPGDVSGSVLPTPEAAWHPCRAAWISKLVPGLGRRVHQCAARRDGGSARAYEPEQGGSSVRAVGSVRETTRADGRVGALLEYAVRSGGALIHSRATGHPAGLPLAPRAQMNCNYLFKWEKLDMPEFNLRLCRISLYLRRFLRLRKSVASLLLPFMRPGHRPVP